MSIHKECGEQIRWAKRSDSEKFMPPLEFVGHYYVLIDSDHEGDEKVATQVACYDIHNCDPAKMEAWIEYREKIDTLKAQSAEAAERLPTNWEIARRRDQENTRARAEKNECKRCGAAVDEPCFNLTVWKRFQRKEATNMPHVERMTWLREED